MVAGLHWRSVKEACPWTSERHGPGRVADRLRGRGGRRRPIDDIAEFAYLTGWRKSEILGLRWAWVDRHTRVIRLPDSKNADGRVLPLVDELWDLIERRWAAREYRAADRTVGIAEYVFHRRGRPLKDIAWAWRSARREAGLPEKLFHLPPHGCPGSRRRRHGLPLGHECHRPQDASRVRALPERGRPADGRGA